MKLFLASKATDPESMKKLLDFDSHLKSKSIAYIPTAANGESWESWKQVDGSWINLKNQGFKINTILLEEFGNSSVINEILKNDVVWMAGGMLGYLLYWIRRCEIDKNLSSILDKCLYIGSSAGSMLLCSNTTAIASWDFVDAEKGVENMQPLNLLNFDIYPHYEDGLFKLIKDKYSGEKLYLLKNGEAVIVEDGQITVLGEERVITK